MPDLMDIEEKTYLTVRINNCVCVIRSWGRCMLQWCLQNQKWAGRVSVQEIAISSSSTPLDILLKSLEPRARTVPLNIYGDLILIHLDHQWRHQILIHLDHQWRHQSQRERTS